MTQRPFYKLASVTLFLNQCAEKEGSWAVGIKVEKEETWQLIKNGEITGLSMAGMAVVEEVTKSDVKNQA
jgi:hypothetical protein